jgi:GDP-L-fucose synthase
LHFIYDLARKILRGQRFGEPVTLWGDGQQRRELVYVDDYVEWVVDLADAASRLIVNVGEGRDHSIRDLAVCICEVAGFPPAELRFDSDAFIGPRTRLLSTGRLDRLLPERRRTPVRDGIAALTAWVGEHLDEIEPRLAS